MWVIPDAIPAARQVDQDQGLSTVNLRIAPLEELTFSLKKKKSSGYRDWRLVKQLLHKCKDLNSAPRSLEKSWAG